MSLITAEEKLIVETAIRNNQSAIAADAIVLLIRSIPYLQDAWDLHDAEKRRAIRNQIGRIVGDIYEG
jgi:hypothetical protein